MPLVTVHSIWLFGVVAAAQVVADLDEPEKFEEAMKKRRDEQGELFAAPKTPLFYYHIPGFSGVSLPMAEFLQVRRFTMIPKPPFFENLSTSYQSRPPSV